MELSTISDGDIVPLGATMDDSLVEYVVDNLVPSERYSCEILFPLENSMVSGRLSVLYDIRTMFRSRSEIILPF